MPADADHLNEENARLKKELQNLQHQREKEKNEFESKIASERELGKSHQEAALQRTHELEAMKSKMVKLTRQLDEEVQKRDQVAPGEETSGPDEGHSRCSDFSVQDGKQRRRAGSARTWQPGLHEVDACGGPVDAAERSAASTP